jgi:hypothetical protein
VWVRRRRRARRQCIEGVETEAEGSTHDAAGSHAIAKVDANVAMTAAVQGNG